MTVWPARPGVRLLHWDQPFNYSAVNNFAVRQARGEVLVFLNDDTEVITPDWLERMVEFALQPRVGAVGAKLFYADGTIQHAGLVVGNCRRHLRSPSALARDDDAHAGRLGVVHNVSAATAACLMMRRSVFDEVGGFDEKFAGDFNDVDLCLKVRATRLPGDLDALRPTLSPRVPDARPHRQSKPAQSLCAGTLALLGSLGSGRGARRSLL